MSDIFTMDVFAKYYDVNKIAPDNFSKYYLEPHILRKNVEKNIFDRPDVKSRIDYILKRKNVSQEDDNINRIMLKTLNEVNNDAKDSYKKAVKILAELQYNKTEHFQKLAEIILEKAITESVFCSLYANICFEMAKYYITADDKQIFFRHILIKITQTNYEKQLMNCEKSDKMKFVGIVKFISELYKIGLFPYKIIGGCFTSLVDNIYKSHNVSECISELISSSYSNLVKDALTNTAAKELLESIKNKLKVLVEDSKLQIKSKFAIQNALDTFKC